MKYFIIASICGFFMLGTALDEKSCAERAGEAFVELNASLHNKFNKIVLQDCCKYPQFFDEKDHNEAEKKIVDGNLGKSGLFYDCLREQMMFQSKGLADKTGKIDKELWKKHVKATIKDKNWEPIYQDAYTKCATGGSKEAQEWQELQKTAIEKCDYKFYTISLCIITVAFQECPKDYWTKKEDLKQPCEFFKNFTLDCGKDRFAADYHKLISADHHKD